MYLGFQDFATVEKNTSSTYFKNIKSHLKSKYVAATRP